MCITNSIMLQLGRGSSSFNKMDIDHVHQPTPLGALSEQTCHPTLHRMIGNVLTTYASFKFVDLKDFYISYSKSASVLLHANLNHMLCAVPKHNQSQQNEQVKFYRVQLHIVLRTAHLLSDITVKICTGNNKKTKVLEHLDS